MPHVTIQIGSGQGPAECELAVVKLLCALQREFPESEVVEQVAGKRAGCLKSAKLTGDARLARLEGTVQWTCQSPFRLTHRRKNWFVDVSVCSIAGCEPFNETQVRFETFHSPGKGGQHLNKTESGARAVYMLTGDAAVSVDERSQHANKKRAVERLRKIVLERNLQQVEFAKTSNWLANKHIVRGNPVRVYSGMAFKLIQERGYDRD
jgi:peptide chain release factor